jgi:hypothetical protein
MKLLLALALIGGLSSCAWPLTIATEDKGEIVFLDGAAPFARIACGAFGPGWTWSSQASARDVTSSVSESDERSLSGTFDVPETPASVAFSESVSRAGPRSLRAAYQLTLTAAAQPNSLWVSLYLPCDLYAGRTVTGLDPAREQRVFLKLPPSLGEANLLSRRDLKKLSISAGSGADFEIEFSPAANVLLQDNRQWGGGEFELRIELLGPYLGSTAPAGVQFAQALTVSFDQDVAFQLDPASAVSNTDTSTWFPYTLPWDAAPLDLSWLNDKPAGGHGFVTAKEGKLVFEDGTPARFWGVCVSAGANFPTHEQSEAIARRMAQFGVNMVRTHHADSGWSDPNFFDESAGDTQQFDRDALDRFDYFLFCLKKNGIYVYLDQLVHRKFTAGDGVANADALDYAAKPYTLFDPTLIALQKKFSRDLWTHVNPYTGLAYHDDPAIALMDFTNENDIFTEDVTVEPYAMAFEQSWREWAAAHSVNPDQPVRRTGERGPDVLRFIDELQKRYYSDMHSYLRSIGVRVPVTGNTWLVVGANLPSQVTMDYMDSHCYWDHPTDNYSRFHNQPQVKVDPATQGNNFATLAMSRALGKPFVCSEWGHPWPNEWRAEGPLATAAVAALQGWDGMLAYTYRHSTEAPVDRITGAFDTFNDPAVFGLFPAAALILRRGDVTEAGSPTVVLWKDSDLFATPQVSAWNSSSAYRSLVERTAVATSLSPVHNPKPVIGPADYVPTAGPTFIASDTGQLRRDWKLGIGTISAPLSQAAYGFLGGAGDIVLRDVTISVTTPFAAVAVTSLDGLPIPDSHHLLVTAVGRVENTGMTYNLTRTQLKEGGAGPILCEPVVGQVSLRTRGRAFEVRAIGPDGSRRLVGSTRVGEDGPAFDLSPSASTIYYELLAK